jgi:hypothetical protein
LRLPFIDLLGLRKPDHAEGEGRDQNEPLMHGSPQIAPKAQFPQAP